MKNSQTLPFYSILTCCLIMLSFIYFDLRKISSVSHRYENKQVEFETRRQLCGTNYNLDKSTEQNHVFFTANESVTSTAIEQKYKHLLLEQEQERTDRQVKRLTEYVGCMMDKLN